MTPKGLTTLAVITILAAVGAAFSIDRDASGSSSEEADGELFPGLLERVNDVARLEVETSEDSFAVRLEGDTWGLESLGGYPVKFETVKQAIVGVADLEVLQAKTKNPAYHDKLGLTDPGGGESRAKRLTLQDASGDVLASVLVGDSKWSGSNQTLYVRRAGEDQAYHCSGKVTIAATPMDWIDRKIVQLGRERLRATTLTSAGGDTLTFERATPDDTNYALRELPPGRELSSPSAGSPLATWATYLSLDEVRPEADVDFAANAGAALESQTFDGLVLRAETATAEGKTWARFQAAYEAPADEPEPMGPEPVPAEEPESSGPDEATVRAEVEELNARLAGWAFALPAYKTEQLAKILDDFLAPLPDPEEESAGGEPSTSPAAPADASGTSEDQ